jgi:hypothetical protein
MRAQPTVASTFYFAEGTCRPGFDTYFCIQNPVDKTANVTITYMKGDGTTNTQTLTVPKHSRSTVSARDRLGTGDDAAHDFSARVDCTNKLPIVVERPMYFNYKGAWTGGSAVVGATSTASTFYFAEGTCRPNFETYFCIQNPGDTNANVTISYTKGNATADSQTLTVARHSRSTVRVKDKLGEGDDDAHDFSSSVSCTNGQGIMVERPMYFNYKGIWTGGSDVIGATDLTPDWYVAEGTTRASSDGEFQEWLCILNPLDRTVTVDITYMLENGQNIDKTYDCPPTSRTTVNVNADVGAGHDVSAEIKGVPHMINPDPHVPTVPSPIAVERVMYFNCKEMWTGGSAALGATSEATNFYFAEGTCRPGFDTYFCIQNPGGGDASVTITYMKGDGTTATQTLTVPKYSRSTVSARDKLGTGDDAAHDFSSAVECTSGQGIIVERPMYFDYKGWTGGDDVMGFHI